MIGRTLLLALAATMLGAAAPPADVRIDDRDVFPESLSADHTGRLYIGSIKGILFRTGPDGNIAEPWIRPSAENGILSILGVLVNEPSKTLWVCSAAMPPAKGASSVLAFDLASGKLKARYLLPAPAAGCNDITIARDGTMFVSETQGARILRLAPDSKELTVFAADPVLKGIDGIALAGDGTLYINNVITGAMARVKRNADGSYAGLAPIALPEALKGPDGLRLLDGKHTFVQAEGTTGRITKITIADDKATMTVLRDGLPSTAGVTPARGRAYAAEGKIGYLFDPKLKGQDPNPFLVHAIPLQPGH